MSKQTEMGAKAKESLFYMLSIADWLSIDMPRYAYEGDEVAVRCSGEHNIFFRKLIYYKNGLQIAVYKSVFSYTISHATISDSGSYYCKIYRQNLLLMEETDESSSVQLTVQGECLTLQINRIGREYGLESRPRIKIKMNISGGGEGGGWLCVLEPKLCALLSGAEKATAYITN